MSNPPGRRQSRPRAEANYGLQRGTTYPGPRQGGVMSG